MICFLVRCCLQLVYLTKLLKRSQFKGKEKLLNKPEKIRNNLHILNERKQCRKKIQRLFFLFILCIIFIYFFFLLFIIEICNILIINYIIIIEGFVIYIFKKRNS